MNDFQKIERILYVIEGLTYYKDEAISPTNEYLRRLLDDIYILAHVGTGRLHECTHPDWENKVNEAEEALEAHGIMKKYTTLLKKKGLDNVNS